MDKTLADWLQTVKSAKAFDHQSFAIWYMVVINGLDSGYTHIATCCEKPISTHNYKYLDFSYLKCLISKRKTDACMQFTMDLRTYSY